MSTPSLSAGLIRRRRRLIAAQVHVSASLLLAALLLQDAAGDLGTTGRWELRLSLYLAAALALLHALLPWTLDRLAPRAQRAGIWTALALAVLPTLGTITTIGFEGIGACQLLLLAAVLAELGPRQRILLFLWASALAVLAASFWHLHDPLL